MSNHTAPFILAEGSDGKLLWAIVREDDYDNSDPFRPAVMRHRYRLYERNQWRLFGDNGGMADPYFVVKDLPSYIAAQKQMIYDYTDKDKWLRMAVMNTACSGVFSSDRTIEEYNNNIWHLKPLKL